MKAGGSKGTAFDGETARRVLRATRSFEGGVPPIAGARVTSAGDDADAVLCKTTAAWAKGSSATLQVWAGEPGSETNTGVTLTAYNRVAAFKSGDFVTVQLNRHGFYYVVGAGGGSVKLSRTTSVWEKGTTTSLVVYGGTPGSEAATGETFNAFNNFGKVLSGKWVMIGENAEGQHYLIAPEADQVELVYSVEIVATTSGGVTTSNLVFKKKKVWVHSIEEGTAVELGLAECVPTYEG